MPAAWERVGLGHYRKVDGKYESQVRLVGELWRSCTSYEGVIVDSGEWDSRPAGFRNATGAVRRGRALRSPVACANQRDDMEDADDE